MLDEIGFVDKDGDGFRDLSNGDQLVINFDFATQGVGGGEVELISNSWNAVGVKTVFKEVTPDEMRSAQSSNQLDVSAWNVSMPLPLILGMNEQFVPPFGDYFNLRTGMLWAEYIDSDGANGVEPPAWAYEMIDDINTFQSLTAGTPESDEVGGRLVANLTGNLVFIGTVAGPYPIVHRNALKNFTQFKTASYEYYRTYPYLAQQWFISE